MASLLIHVLRLVFATMAHAVVYHGGDLYRFKDAAPMRTQRLDNHADASYTGNITVGAQSLAAVFDTGSFELVVLSNKCFNCGTSSRLFDSAGSASYELQGVEGQKRYGSGVAYVKAAYDTVAIEEMVATNELFWDVYKADSSLSSLFDKNWFAAILGIGPPTSVQAFAAANVKIMHSRAADYESYGGMPEDDKVVMKQYEDALELSKTSTTVLDQLEIHSMSVCFGRESRSPGYFTWHDTAPHDFSSLFQSVPVVGEFYWSAALGDVKIAAADSNQMTHSLGCSGAGSCSAVMDTGTTFITAPFIAVDAVNRFIAAWLDNGGTCKDLSKLPNLEFTLGGKPFSLPPEAYVAEFSGSSAGFFRARKMLPHLYKTHMERQKFLETSGRKLNSDHSDVYCSSVLSSMDVDTQFGQLWIIGASFFRQYYTNFQMIAGQRLLKGSTMQFSVAGDTCKPHRNPNLSQSAKAGFVGQREAQLKIDIDSVRTSSLLDRLELIEPLHNLHDKLHQENGPMPEDRYFVRI